LARLSSIEQAMARPLHGCLRARCERRVGAAIGCCIALLFSLGCRPQGENPAHGCNHCVAPDRCVRGFCIPGIKTRDAGQAPQPKVDAGSGEPCPQDGDSRACYSGPDGTLGNGHCHAGAQRCRMGVWTPCGNELLPDVETCNAFDDDCDGKIDEDFALSTSNENCGVCNHRCAANRTCCNAVCVDVQSDTGNCGQCGMACDAQRACCGGACRDTKSDAANCGTCGMACQLGSSCCNGSCADTQVDPSHCGSSCAHCGTGEGCCTGTCTDLGTAQHCGACTTACDPAREVCCDHACTTDLQMCGDT
jgi:hypothetical protein